MSQLQAHHFTHNAVCHFNAADKDKHIEYQLTDIAPHLVTAAAEVFTVGGLDANTEKITQASTMIAPSRSTAQ